MMLKTKNLALLSALVAAGISLLLLFNVDSSTTEVKLNSESPQPSQMTKTEPTTEVPQTPTVEDPFKKFLDQKAGSSNTVTKTDNAQVVPVQPGKDPFKEFLEKQKQKTKDQVVSPFGKN